MTTPVYSQITAANIQARIFALLRTLDDVLSQIRDEQDHFASFSSAQLQSVGLSASDFQFLASALADANGFANIAFTGTDPRNPGPGYVYANSWKQVLGPLWKSMVLFSGIARTLPGLF